MGIIHLNTAVYRSKKYVPTYMNTADSLKGMQEYYSTNYACVKGDKVQSKTMKKIWMPFIFYRISRHKKH